uniref:Uncharacterized protein n=2 Tax=Dendroctonus ponderosae TaxID=77166 RepID=A0AAR5P058_DENPD
MLEKMDQLECLTNSIKLQREVINKINTENENLKEEIDTLNNRNKTETERLQELVNHSQNQVAVLLKEHDEKTAQFQSVAHELDNIRTSVTQDNDNLMGQITQLQQENESIQKENELINICQCEEAQNEIDRLKMELCKKQCIVLELEKSVDNFNETLRNFDSTAEELACENTCLKSERARLLKKLEILQQEISVNNAELVKMKNQTQINNKSCSERNKALEQENEALKNNLLQLNTEKRDLEKDLINNCHKQMEVENMKQDYTRRASSTAKKLDDLQTVHSELKSLFDKTYAENKKLRAEFKNHAGCKEDLQQLLKKTEFLQSENEKLTKQADSLKTECNQLRKECATRCLEAFTLKEAVENEKQQNRLCDENCQELKQKQKSNEVELVKLREQLDKMCEKYEQKSEDLKKVQKQWESCAKQCQISKDEYNNLRKEYKDIKAMLTDQIKKYKVDGHSMEAGRNCKVSKDIKEELMKKENEIITLHQKLRNASCEIIELKDYVQKLICDNHLLKSAINGLISNLENKIKGPSFGSLPSNSAEIIAGEILNSLTTIEDIIVKKGDSCPGCPGKYCDCMSEITQQYSYKSISDTSKTDVPHAAKARISVCSGTSRHPCEKRLNMERSSQFDCVESCKKLRKRLLKSASQHLSSKTSSAEIELGSKTNTTDSDDLNPTKFDNK